MTTPNDETRVGLVMREMLGSAAARKPPVEPSELRRRAGRGAIRPVDTKVFLTVAAVAAVIVTLIVVGPLRSDNPPSPPPTATQPTSTTAPTTTTTTTVPEAAASQLDAYVAAEQQTDSTAYAASGLNVGGFNPFVSVHSPPVADDGRTVALAAFTYDPAGLPVQILTYRDGQWTILTERGAPPAGNSTADNNPPSFEALAPDPVSVADVTGDGQPDFLVMESAADNVPGFVVSQDGGRWRYIAFQGPYAPSPTYVIARGPTFDGHTLESDYDNCVPDCAAGTNTTIVWTYNRSTGQFTAPNPPGYVG